MLWKKICCYCKAAQRLVPAVAAERTKEHTIRRAVGKLGIFENVGKSTFTSKYLFYLKCIGNVRTVEFILVHEAKTWNCWCERSVDCTRLSPTESQGKCRLFSLRHVRARQNSTTMRLIMFCTRHRWHTWAHWHIDFGSIAIGLCISLRGCKGCPEHGRSHRDWILPRTSNKPRNVFLSVQFIRSSRKEACCV